MPTTNDIVTQMIQKLTVSIPNLDTAIGSPARAFLDVVAEVVSEQTADQYLTQYAYDVDSMTGSNLDAFVNIFGITRFAAKRAVGYITLTSAANVPQDVLFGTATQVCTSGSPKLIFVTMVPATMTAGTNSITIPIQASIAGSSGNVPANTITQPYSSMPAVSSITNLNALSGGTDAETDDQLRARFKATVFRALTGTSSMYAATALENPYATQVNVIGATEVQNEQIQLVNGVGVSSVNNLVYLYPKTAFFGPNIYQGDIFSPGQFSITAETVPPPAAPTVTPTTGTGTLPAGSYTYALTITTIGGVTILGLPTTVNLSSTGENTVSWTGLQTTVAAASNGVNVNTFAGSTGILNVASTSGFPTAGMLNVATGSGTVQVSYTGITATSFTGCSCQASGLLSTGGVVSFADVLNYSIYRMVSGVFEFLTEVGPTTFSYVDNNAIAPTSGAVPPVLNSTGSPVIRSLDPINVPDGVYQLQYNYLSASSRNDPVNQITNRIDIYVNGINPTETFQNIMAGPMLTFNDTDPMTVETIPTSMNIQLFQRSTGVPPAVGNLFTPFAFAPVIDMANNANGPALNPATIGGTNWVEGINYWVVNDVSQFGGSAFSRAGIEWLAPGPASPNTSVALHYLFNQVPSAIQRAVETWRLVTTDVMVHQALNVYLNMYFAVVLNPGYSLSSVLSAIEAAISNYLTSVNFGGIVQVSQILSTVQQVPGVLGVRFLTSADGYRTDAVTVTSGSSTITDASILLSDEGSPVNGTGIPADSFVGRIGSGSFTLVDEVGIAVNATANGSAIEIGTNMKLFGTGTLNGDLANGHYAIQQVNWVTEAVMQTFATTLGAPLRVTDFFLQDDQLAVLNNVYLIQQAPNSFGAV